MHPVKIQSRQGKVDFGTIGGGHRAHIEAWAGQAGGNNSRIILVGCIFKELQTIFMFVYDEWMIIRYHGH
jgi:hypothetical protein